jgi:predicted aldo/keto reductase-like oxidoreductase
MGVVTMNTLGGGLIPNHPDHFAFVKHEGDRSLVEAALRFNLSLPEVTTALVGFRNTSDVDEAVEAVERFEPLTTEEIKAHREKLAAASEDFCTQCGYCRDCPADIPVVRIMEAYNHHLLGGNPQATFNHLRYHWGIPDLAKALEACTECRQCEEACTQHLPILERFEELKETQARKG